MDVLSQMPVPVDRIIPREEAASGAYLDRAPDLHLILDGYRTIAFPLFATDAKSSRGRFAAIQAAIVCMARSSRVGQA